MLQQKAIDHLNLSVPNLEKAIEFYTKTLNFEIKHRFQKEGMDFVFVSDGNILYEILEKPNLTEAVFDHIAYVSEDIEADYNYFKELDPSLLLGEIGFVDFLFDHGMYYFFVKGPGNERIEYCQKRK